MFQSYFSVMCYRRRKKNAGPVRLSDAKIQYLKFEFAAKRKSVTTSKESVSVPAPVKLRRKIRGHRAQVVYISLW
jgi:hypothetical protein